MKLKYVLSIVTKLIFELDTKITHTCQRYPLWIMWITWCITFFIVKIRGFKLWITCFLFTWNFMSLFNIGIFLLFFCAICTGIEIYNLNRDLLILSIFSKQNWIFFQFSKYSIFAMVPLILKYAGIWFGLHGFSCQLLTCYATLCMIVSFTYYLLD